MRTENIEVKITIPIPFDKPDKNGVVYTEDAVSNAVSNLQNLPIIYRDNENEPEGKVIGVMNKPTYVEEWDMKNQVCKITIDGAVFYGGTECIVNEMKDDKVTDFEIVGVGLSK